MCGSKLPPLLAIALPDEKSGPVGTSDIGAFYSELTAAEHKRDAGTAQMRAD